MFSRFLILNKRRNKLWHFFPPHFWPSISSTTPEAHRHVLCQSVANEI